MFVFHPIQFGQTAASTFFQGLEGFCVIQDSAEIERVIREYRKNPAVIREFYISCDAGFSLSVVRDS